MKAEGDLPLRGQHQQVPEVRGGTFGFDYGGDAPIIVAMASVADLRFHPLTVVQGFYPASYSHRIAVQFVGLAADVGVEGPTYSLRDG